MATTIHLDYCGMAASGATVREAKQEAARKLTSLVSDLTRHSPEIVTCGAYSSLVYRDAYGWQSCLITDQNGAVRSGRVYGGGGEIDRADAIMSARAHVAQLAWSVAVENDQRFAEAAGLDRRKIADLVSWAAWQRRYRAAADAGCSAQDAFAIAGGLQAMPVQTAA